MSLHPSKTEAITAHGYLISSGLLYRLPQKGQGASLYAYTKPRPFSCCKSQFNPLRPIAPKEVEMKSLTSLSTSQLSRLWIVLAAGLLGVILVATLTPLEANAAAALPSGFQESTVFSGLTNPTAVQFSKDGRVFVAEKSGLIKVFDNLSDTTPTTFADLRTKVHNFWDRGMLGMVLDPNYPTNPYVYVLYTHDAAIGGTAPRWGTAGATSDGCPTPPGATADGCVVSGRLSRLQANPTTNTMSGPEQVLIEDWCQQYPSHSVGSLVFGSSDRALYVSGGDGASFNFADYGQDGNPLNPCGDPPVGVGGTLTAPTAEGGALRSQDLRTSGDPVSLDGAILRVDPATGAALPNNPLIANSDPNAKRIIAYGLRNPFRQTLVARPGTDEIWVGDVGWGQWEEINRIANPTDSTVENFGWPCYEGNGRQGGLRRLKPQHLREPLRAGQRGQHAALHLQPHAKVVAGESCTAGSSSISGLAFYKGGPYPDEYDDALFFADHSRRCIWVMQKGNNGLPNPGLLKTFVANAENPVDLQIGPNGDLFYVDFEGGTIRRIQYTAANPNQPPVAHATANPTSGAVPLTVSFDATGSSDPDGDTLTYEWDLDGDGAYDDSTSAQPTFTYTAAGNYQVGLRVTDSQWGIRHPRSAADHKRGEHSAHGDHRLPISHHHLEGGGHYLLLRLGHRPPRWGACRLQADVVLDHAPLPVQLPRARSAGLCGCGERIVRRARPRVSLLLGAPAHCYGLGRAQRHQERAAGSQDRRSHISIRPHGAATDAWAAQAELRPSPAR